MIPSGKIETTLFHHSDHFSLNKSHICQLDLSVDPTSVHSRHVSVAVVLYSRMGCDAEAPILIFHNVIVQGFPDLSVYVLLDKNFLLPTNGSNWTGSSPPTHPCICEE